MVDMAPNTVFSSADGDYLIIPQAGTLDIETELGSLLVRQNEIAVIPRGIRYRVTLPQGPARGYICELYHGHFQLPELGPVGSCALANARDFQVPVARFDGRVENGVATCSPSQSWKTITKIANRHFICERKTTPFDVAAWHGTYYPHKYDLGRFAVLGSLLFDHPDPSLYTVLTAPSHREPGSAIVDFAIVPPRWQVAENTYWAPYYHRNTMSEFAGWIINSQDPNYPVPKGFTFKPFVGQLTNAMVPHGLDKASHEIVSTIDTSPQKVDDQGHCMFLLESEYMLNVTDWGMKALGHRFPTSSKPKM
jgi:homogentisate 1,2-dioxygenase